MNLCHSAYNKFYHGRKKTFTLRTKRGEFFYYFSRRRLNIILIEIVCDDIYIYIYVYYTRIYVDREENDRTYIEF